MRFFGHDEEQEIEKFGRTSEVIELNRMLKLSLQVAMLSKTQHDYWQSTKSA